MLAKTLVYLSENAIFEVTGEIKNYRKWKIEAILYLNQLEGNAGQLWANLVQLWPTWPQLWPT